MSRVTQIVGALLEVEDFSARDYLLDPDAETNEVLQAIKQGLASYFENVEVYPASEGLANFPKFFYQGNRYRIRCKRSGPPLRLLPRDPYANRGTAEQHKIIIREMVEQTAEKFGFYVHKLEFSGNVFSNLLIILDMWPRESSFRKKVAPQ